LSFSLCTGGQNSAGGATCPFISLRNKEKKKGGYCGFASPLWTWSLCVFNSSGVLNFWPHTSQAFGSVA
jgi:hypothetical protein